MDRNCNKSVYGILFKNGARVVRLVSTDHKQIDKQKILRTQRQKTDKRTCRFFVFSGCLPYMGNTPARAMLSGCLFFQATYPIRAIPQHGQCFQAALNFSSVYGCCALVPMRLRLL